MTAGTRLSVTVSGGRPSGCIGPNVELGSEVEGGHSGLAEEMRGDRQTLKTWALTACGPKKGSRRNFLFIFRKHFREKQNNLEISR
jgi:hypothetical protein